MAMHLQGAVLYSTGGRRPNSIVIQDVNGDGIPDLLVAQYKKNDVAGAIGVLLGREMAPSRGRQSTCRMG